MAYGRIKWTAVILPAAALGIWEWFRHRTLDPVLPEGVGNLLSAAVVAVGAYFFVTDLVHRIEAAAQDASRAWQAAAVVRERQRIAREMHDSVAQALFYLNVRLADIDRGLGEQEPEAVRDRLREVRASLDGTYQRVRAVITDLRREEEAESLVSHLRRVVGEYRNHPRLGVALTAHGDQVLDPAVRNHLAAIVQEALINADKHSEATQASVTVELRSKGVLLRVEDNGRGFDPAQVKPGSHGLMIMQERASLAGGTLRIETSPGRGTTVTVAVEEGV